MKKIVFILGLLLFSGLQAEQIPIEDFAKKSQFKDVRISPDGKHVAFTYEDDNQVKLAIMDLENKDIKFSFGAGDGREIIQFFWPNNDRVVMLQRKITGWLDGARQYPRLVAGNIDGTERDLLWDFQRSSLRIVSDLESDPEKILVGKYHFTEGDVKLHRMDIYKGELYYEQDSPRPVGENGLIRSINVDLDDVPRFAVELDLMDEDDATDDIQRLHIKNKKGEWESIILPKKREDFPSPSAIGFNEAGDRFYFTSNHDLDHDGTEGLFVLDTETKKIELLFRHDDVDILGGIYGSEGEVIGAYYEPGYPSYYYLDNPDVAKEVSFHKRLRASFKGSKLRMSNYSDDGRLSIVNVSSDKNPGDFYLFNRETNKARYIASSMPHIDPKKMAQVEPFAMNARDGLKMYGQMTIPNGKELKDLPMVVFPHGGPYGVADSWRFDWRAQLLANRGYLVLQLNYRGSGGYGDDFREAGNGEWGTKMQDDLADATLWAINQGFADKNRVCMHGISYGGYASMNAAVRHPDLYQCVIPEAGLYDAELQWDKADSFRNASEEYKNSFLTMSFGSADQETLEERSPAFHAEKVKAPVFLIHGEDDVRVPIENAYVMEEALKKAGKEVQTYYREDGHGFQKVEYRIESFELIFDFLEEHIGK
ncbi:S9 family peptidase [Kangiella sediminilitoris]|uniref:Peptidase S9 prolyl oligopeptidase active site domain protein n=1 Tax=Kangiella sediminilitoris TaxID=1144748 RepID=A0A1B3B909_9GAMM|nr:S9 family peptidase [Kangiella sediminilitoris]AOE49236.1 Peptidase S9 prolyl oligopeptidase active site domain protein [Kangiella sediminilitoris]